MSPVHIAEAYIGQEKALRSVAALRCRAVSWRKTWYAREPSMGEVMPSDIGATHDNPMVHESHAGKGVRRVISETKGP